MPVNINADAWAAAGGRGAIPTPTTATGVNYDPNKPDDVLAAIIKREEARYNEDYVPVEDQAIATLDDMTIIEDAKKNVADTSGLGRSVGRAQRDASRYGFRMNQAQLDNATVNAQLGKATSDANTMNNARLDQFDRNKGFRNELINIGRGVSGQAVDGLTEAAGMKSARDARNSQASAARSAQNMQAAASLASLAIFAL